MGIAQDKHLGALVEHLLQPFEIHPVTPALEHHRIVHNHTSQPLREQAEMVIHRRLDNNLVPRLREGEIRLVDGSNHARSIAHPFPGNLPAMLPAFPGADGLEELFRRAGIAQDIPVQALPECFPDGGVRPEIHIGNPHGEAVLTRTAVFDAPCPGTVDDFVEIPAFRRRLCGTALQQGARRQQRSRPGRRHAFQE